MTQSVMLQERAEGTPGIKCGTAGEAFVCPVPLLPLPLMKKRRERPDALAKARRSASPRE
jgi:hypothetical protein